MKNIMVLVIFLKPLLFGTLAFAGQYQGGSGSGGAMGEYEGRLDGGKGSRDEIASSERVKSHLPRNDGGRVHNDGSEGAQYRGGPGSGGAMGEWEGRLDGKKK